MITPIMEAEDSEGIDECAYLLSLIRKTERKVTFKQFQEAVKLLAEKKYPGDPSGLSKLTTKITSGKGPTTSGTTVCNHIVFTTPIHTYNIYVCKLYTC